MPVVEGRIEEFSRSQPNAPFTAVIMLPSGSTIRLKTFDEMLAAEVGQVRVRGEVAGFDYVDQVSKKLNPHTNQPYQDHMLRRILPAGSAPANGGSGGIPGLDTPMSSGPAAATVQTVQGLDAAPSPRFEDPDKRAWRIALGAGAHLAVDSLAHLESKGYDTGLDAQKQVALAWALWIYNEGSTLPGASETEPPTQPHSYEEPDADDIPF